MDFRGHQATTSVTAKVATPFDLGEFVEHQGEQRIKAAKVFENIFEKVFNVAESVCSEVNKRALPSDDLTAHVAGHAEGSMMPLSTAVPMLDRIVSRSKSRSMASIREEQETRRRALKRAAAEANVLPSFVRLVDYLAVEALASLVVSVTGAFCSELHREPRRA